MCSKWVYLSFIVLVPALAGPAVSQSSATEPFTFVQVADPQLGWGYGYDNDVNSLKQAVRFVNALNVDFVVICGDLVNSFNDQSIADFKAITSGLSVPCYAAPGNHDVGNTPTALSLERYRAAMGADYYSFEHKGYTFVIADTSLWKAPLAGESDKQDAWLRQTLTAAHDKNSPVFMAGHYALYITKPDEAEEYYNLPPAKRSELLALYEASGVVAVLGGHRHLLVINDYKGIQLVNGEVTSRHFDGSPLGLRLWHVDSPTSITHEFRPLAPGMDFNGDEIIDTADVVIMVNHWLQDYAPCDIAPPPYGDGIVDANDLILLAEHLFEDYRMAAYWKLDEKSGTVARDSSASRADGVVAGNPTWQPADGQVDGAIELDGIDDYVSTPAVLDPAKAPFSAFVWVKGGAPGQVVLSQTGTPWGTNWLRADSLDGSLMTELKGTGRWDRPLASTTIITDGLWHHVGLVWDGTNRTLYVDDAVAATDAHNPLAISNDGLNIGAGKNLDPGTFWSGLIDDVRIYNRAMTPQ
ncbi:MAG TPA: LamG-like jellyroll fold domain-containing protein [Sedimentisphaerales bacterium]|nr:LamG-like jellyroll fold domain-containing protein [Sedimentisphaerales bacterium]